MYAKIFGIDDIDSIKKYTNLNIFINKDSLPEAEENEAYWYELIGMKVIDVKSKDILGIVEKLNNYGANDCLELIPTQESIDDQNRLIPFVIDKFISSINREESTIFVNWDKSF